MLVLPVPDRLRAPVRRFCVGKIHGRGACADPDRGCRTVAATFFNRVQRRNQIGALFGRTPDQDRWPFDGSDGACRSKMASCRVVRRRGTSPRPRPPHLRSTPLGRSGLAKRQFARPRFRSVQSAKKLQRFPRRRTGPSTRAHVFHRLAGLGPPAPRRRRSCPTSGTPREFPELPSSPVRGTTGIRSSGLSIQ